MSETHHRAAQVVDTDKTVFENVERFIDLRRSPNDAPCPTRVIDVVKTDKNGRRSIAELHLLADLIPASK